MNEVDKFGHVVHLTSLQALSAIKPKPIAADVAAPGADASSSGAAEVPPKEKQEGKTLWHRARGHL